MEVCSEPTIIHECFTESAAHLIATFLYLGARLPSIMDHEKLHCVLNIVLVLFAVLVYLLLAAFLGDKSNVDTLTQCLQQGGVQNFSTPDDQTFEYLLDFSAQNLRLSEAAVPKPKALIFPFSAEQVRTALNCSMRSGLELRVRSGGHSYEGLSYTSERPFLIIDMMNMHNVTINAAGSEGRPTAWVQPGATLGEIYAGIADETSEYGFPAGICPTVGSGGHFAVGGHGYLARKYGLAADNVVDAQLVNASLQLVGRREMGEDLFWALRGGGGGSWGIVVAWKIMLVRVPPTATTFSVTRTGKQKLAELLHQWQWRASNWAPAGLSITARVITTGNGEVKVNFTGQNLGTREETVEWMQVYLPAMEVAAADCEEGTWIDAVVRMGHARDRKELLDRLNRHKDYFKAKSDYVKNNISQDGWEEILGALAKAPSGCESSMYLEPYGGAMWNISSDAIAFPHRAGNLFSIEYGVAWSKDTHSQAHEYISWLRNFYNSTMTPFVSHSPRASYSGFVDLDLGTSTTVQEANKTWGTSYFLKNFDRLVKAKTNSDPLNIFKQPQSIPVGNSPLNAFSTIKWYK